MGCSGNRFCNNRHSILSNVQSSIETLQHLHGHVPPSFEVIVLLPNLNLVFAVAEEAYPLSEAVQSLGVGMQHLGNVDLLVASPLNISTDRLLDLMTA